MDLYNTVKSQNSMIKDQTTQMQHQYSTDKQKIVLLYQSLGWYSFFSFILWCVYYFTCFFIVYFVLFGSSSEETSIFSKIVTLTFFFFYPLFITPLENYLLNGIEFIRAYFSGTIYTDLRKNTPPLSTNLLYARPYSQ
jgi:hypothetical protein